MQIRAKFILKTAGPRPTVYTAAELHDDGTVTATYWRFMPMANRSEARTSSPIPIDACKVIEKAVH